MRQQAMSSKMVFNRPMPVNRIVSSIADSECRMSSHLSNYSQSVGMLEAQVNTQEYGRRPYGVGFLVIGQDQSGPHLYEFSPSGNSYEYFAMSIGARSQSAKTYLEKHYEEFMPCTFHAACSARHKESNDLFQALWRSLYNTDSMLCAKRSSRTKSSRSTTHRLALLGRRASTRRTSLRKVPSAFWRRRRWTRTSRHYSRKRIPPLLPRPNRLQQQQLMHPRPLQATRMFRWRGDRVVAFLMDYKTVQNGDESEEGSADISYFCANFKSTCSPTLETQKATAPIARLCAKIVSVIA